MQSENVKKRYPITGWLAADQWFYYRNRAGYSARMEISSTSKTAKIFEDLKMNLW